MADKVRLFLKPPGWNPPDLGGFTPAPEVGPSPSKFQVAIPRRVQVYVLAQFVVLLLTGSVFLFHQEQLTPAARAGVASAIVASLLILGALLDGRRWAFAAETARLAGAAMAGVLLAPWTTAVPLAVAAAALGWWVIRHRPVLAHAASPSPQTA